MNWKCSECGSIEGEEQNEKEVQIQALCHHCGKPLCQKDRMLIKDDAFYTDRIAKAYHCHSCKQTFHPNAFVIKE